MDSPERLHCSLLESALVLPATQAKLQCPLPLISAQKHETERGTTPHTMPFQRYCIRSAAVLFVHAVRCDLLGRRDCSCAVHFAQPQPSSSCTPTAQSADHLTAEFAKSTQTHFRLRPTLCSLTTTPSGRQHTALSPRQSLPCGGWTFLHLDTAEATAAPHRASAAWDREHVHHRGRRQSGLKCWRPWTHGR